MKLELRTEGDDFVNITFKIDNIRLDDGDCIARTGM